MVDLFDNAKRCNQVAKDQAGTVMDLTINPTTQNVLVEVVRSTDGWDKAFLLEHCAVVNKSNWRCIRESKIGFTEASAFPVKSEFGMLQGRFYRSYTSRDPAQLLFLKHFRLAILGVLGRDTLVR
jgi:hypothetical protein